MTGLRAFTIEEAKNFASRWLPAWSGNEPERLAAFYAEDCFYLDPGVPAGLHGRSELLIYLRRLLARYPDWTWTQIEAIPMDGGFLNKWLARIPVASKTVEVTGVCLVQINTEGFISRNEVYFDRLSLHR